MSLFLTEAQKEQLRKRICPGCLYGVALVPGMFHTRTTGSMPGLLCSNAGCKALWDDPDNSFIEAASQKRGGT